MRKVIDFILDKQVLASLIYASWVILHIAIILLDDLINC